MPRLGLAVLAFLISAGSAAAGDVVSSGPAAIAVSLYRNAPIDTSDLMHPGPYSQDYGLAFISETRNIDLPAGPSVVKFRGVAATMVPQTAEIEGFPSGILERNFDYDLLSPGSLLAKSIGRTVRLVRVDAHTGKTVEQTAIVRTGPNGAMFEIDGKLEALRCSGLPERLIFERLPDNLADTPTLSVHTNAPTAGRYTIKLTYIAIGLNWSADYVAHLIPGTDHLALTGWLTLANFSATSFPRVPIDVIAGNLSTTGDDEPVHPKRVVFASNCWPTEIDWATHHYPPPPPPPPPPAPMQELKFEGDTSTETVVVTGSRMPSEFAFGDYKLYRLAEPTTLAARQTKQIQFLNQPTVRYERFYRYDIDTDSDAEPDIGASIVYRFQNRAEAGLGRSLPAGNISVFERANKGAAVFDGQAKIRDISVGLPIEISTGYAVDVRIEPSGRRETRGEGKAKIIHSDWEINIENEKPVPAVLEMRQYLFEGTAKIEQESDAYEKKSGAAVWSFNLPAHSHRVLHYVVEHPAIY